MAVTQTEWFRAGLDLLALDGHHKLTIEAVCRHLKVTKGSFYHHFQNRQTYLDGLMGYWYQTYTLDILAETEQESSIAEKSRRLMAITHNIDDCAGQSIRAWAQSDVNCATWLRQADDKRIAYLHQLIAAQLKPELLPQSQLIARLIYAHFLGTQQLGEMFDLSEKQAMDMLLHSVFCEEK